MQPRTLIFLFLFCALHILLSYTRIPHPALIECITILTVNILPLSCTFGHSLPLAKVEKFHSVLVLMTLSNFLLKKSRQCTSSVRTPEPWGLRVKTESPFLLGKAAPITFLRGRPPLFLLYFLLSRVMKSYFFGFLLLWKGIRQVRGLSSLCCPFRPIFIPAGNEFPVGTIEFRGGIAELTLAPAPFLLRNIKI